MKTVAETVNYVVVEMDKLKVVLSGKKKDIWMVVAMEIEMDDQKVVEMDKPKVVVKESWKDKQMVAEME
jgi:hypothetical protein